MTLSTQSILFVQYFEGTDDYLVHYDGGTSETYHGWDKVKGTDIGKFIRECEEAGCYRRNTIYLNTGRVEGDKKLQVKQITYSRLFRNVEEKSGKKPSINWVLWCPHECECTINTGVLGYQKTVHVNAIEDAGQAVLDFITYCIKNGGTALVRNVNSTISDGGKKKLSSYSEYYFSMGSKIVYGFKTGGASTITEHDIRAIGVII